MFFRVKAMNRLGESSWSEYGSVTTLIDAERIPRVSGLTWDNETSSLGFMVTRVYPLYLVARVEARMERLGSSNNTWQLIKTAPLKKKPYSFLLPRNLKFSNLRSDYCSSSFFVTTPHCSFVILSVSLSIVLTHSSLLSGSRSVLRLSPGSAASPLS